MSDNEILKEVQQEFPNAEYEKTITRSAMRIAAATGIICTVIMIIVEWLAFKKFDFGKPFLIMLIAGLIDIVEWSKLRAKKSLIIMGCLKLLFASIFLLLYITSLIGV